MNSTAIMLLDALVIGSGPAGLSVATGLARQLHTAVVFDSGVYRNQLSRNMHNVVTWDHRKPTEFRDAARNDILKRYTTINFQKVTIKEVKKTASGLFEAIDVTGHVWLGKKLVLATGVEDILPDIDGYADGWAAGIFHCLFCDGYEERGVASAGVLAVEAVANTQRALHLARIARRLTKQVTIYTNGNVALSEELQAEVDNTGMIVDSRPLSHLEKGRAGTEMVLHFDKPSAVTTEGFLVHSPRTRVNGPFAQQLSLDMTENGDIAVKPPFYETSMPGVFAVGDNATFLKTVTQSVAMGTCAAGGLAFQLQAEDS